MKVERVEIFVEEASMEAALRVLVPKIVDLDFEVYPHDSKPELLARLPTRLAGYAAWMPASWRILVIVDRDADDCVALRQQLDAISVRAGLRPDAKPGHTRQVVNRIAIEELEAWFFGDWDAVRAAYPYASATVPRQARYRDPDAIAGGTWEAMERVLQRAGYFRAGLRKVEAARSIAAHWVPSRNSSRSFQKLMDCLGELTCPMVPLQKE